MKKGEIIHIESLFICRWVFLYFNHILYFNLFFKVLMKELNGALNDKKIICVCAMVAQ